MIHLRIIYLLKIDTCNEKSKARERKAGAYALQQQLKRRVSWALRGTIG